MLPKLISSSLVNSIAIDMEPEDGGDDDVSIDSSQSCMLSVFFATAWTNIYSSHRTRWWFDPPWKGQTPTQHDLWANSLIRHLLNSIYLHQSTVESFLTQSSSSTKLNHHVFILTCFYYRILWYTIKTRKTCTCRHQLCPEMFEGGHYSNVMINGCHESGCHEYG